MASRQGQQSTTSGGSADGSKLPHGQFPVAGGRPPRRPRRGDQMTGVALDGTRSADTAQRNAEAIEAQRLVNSGAADSDGAGPAPGFDDFLSGGPGSKTTTWADPSSLSR